ncbi:MAG: isochorismatase family protein [Planctomycetia bacterium]|nr:isochorismatase family protein [Planctomycetia bacterium]
MTLTERLTAPHGALLVVDLQEKLLAAIEGREAVVANAVRLVRAARLLAMPVGSTEQYPKGLGPSVNDLAELVPERWPKTTFHCCSVPQFLESLYGRSVRHVTVAGIEAHVCVAQTVLELMHLGFRVQVPADAVASRHRIDWEFALRRLERAGAVVSTTEAVLFEWTEQSDRPEFKAISEMIKAHDARPSSENRS